LEFAMRAWGKSVSAAELGIIARACDAFRRKWESFESPWPARFDGTITDCKAMDYMLRAGVEFPDCGIGGAALVCGEVLRRAAELEWVVSHRGDWFVASPEGVDSAIAICPLIRLHEMEFGGVPKEGKYRRMVVRAALDCLDLAPARVTPKLLQLLDADDEYVRGMTMLLKRVALPAERSWYE
jgi:hypothetical protein